MKLEGPVLLTGATGFVGSRVARRLLAAGVPVRAIVRRAGADAELAQHAGYGEVVGDFVDADVALEAAKGCACVVHAAATSGPELEPVRRVNVEGTRAMLDAARSAGARRYVQISTLSVYDVDGRDVVDETTPLKRDADPYGSTKAEGDRLVLAAAKRGLAAVILRPGAILGVHPTSTWAVKVPTRIREGKIKLLGDGGNRMVFVHVEDLVDAVLLGLTDDRAVGGVYDVVERNTTWRVYTDEVRRWFSMPALPSYSDEEVAAGKMVHWTGAFGSDRLARELGWAPRRTFEAGMAEAAAYWGGILTAQDNT
jgi:nucleoside-diphosphate-sugar epimerase